MWARAAAVLMLTGCSESTLTIPASSIPDYAAHKSARTVEGPHVSLADGGALQPVAVGGGPLSVISRQSLAGFQMTYLGNGNNDDGVSSIVHDVVEVELGKNLTILGARSGVRVNAAYVGGLRVIDSRKSGRKGLSTGAVVGISVGAIAGLALIGLGIYGLTQIDGVGL